jgi:transcriptional regulator with PAS, ATPase and Fis domain
MIESIKAKLWDLLKEKDVSLAMLYDREGNILWHMGREIIGKTIDEGERFSKSYIKKTLNSGDVIETEDVFITLTGSDLPESAIFLPIKSLIILPIDSHFFLYIDSGTKKSFTETDREVFKVLGELLGKMIEQIERNEKEIGGISGSSPQIQKIRKLVLKYSIEIKPVLLIGETGVGKNHTAELIHRFSGRKGRYVEVAIPSIPESLFESEVFGHKKGAFTGANENKQGLIKEAEGGTFFFDEIADIPISFQAKLLQLIDTNKYRTLGDSTERKADVRIIAATNRSLGEEIKARRFRKDLFYRLNALTLEIPPLRERKEDMRSIVRENEKHFKGKRIGPGFWEVVLKHHWPGNVRELLHVIWRAGIELKGPVIGKEIEDIIQGSYRSDDVSGNRVDQIWGEIQSGRSFWEAVKRPFLNRDLNRLEVKKIIDRALKCGDGKYKNVLDIFNVKSEDYKKFLNFIYDNNLK